MLSVRKSDKFSKWYPESGNIETNSKKQKQKTKQQNIILSLALTDINVAKIHVTGVTSQSFTMFYLLSPFFLHFYSYNKKTA